MMERIVIAGGTGFIGTLLVKRLSDAGYEVVVLSRKPSMTLVKGSYLRVHWDGKKPGEWVDLIDGSLAVINLAGENIGSGLWTPNRKKLIISSRVDAGRILEWAVQQARFKPKKFLQTSAIGFYGPSGDKVLNEFSPNGNGFLAGVCRQWEDSSKGLESMGVGRVLLRTGIVLSLTSGVLPKLILPTRLFIGGPLGSGSQFWSWISFQDVVRAVHFLMEKEEANGIYNLTSPEPAVVTELGKTLAAIYHRPFWLPVPSFALRLLLGQMSSLILDSQRVVPLRLLEAGFQFENPDLKSALLGLIEKS